MTVFDCFTVNRRAGRCIVYAKKNASWVVCAVDISTAPEAWWRNTVWAASRDLAPSCMRCIAQRGVVYGILLMNHNEAE